MTPEIDLPSANNMAFFKFRKSGDEQSATSAQPESVEAMRRRAKHRLIGAAVLVLIGVIGFPLLFDKQPRPVSVDMPIEIPDRNKVKPLAVPPPAAPNSVAPDPAAPVVPAVPVTAPAAVSIGEEKVAAPLVVPENDASKNIAKAEAKSVEKPADKTVTPAVKADEGTKAQALLAGTNPEKKADASEGRFVVQVGAFADVARAREVRLKLEHMGLKTYTQLVETKDGRRIRVRVGPFAGKTEADKAADKIKRIDLPAAILSL